MEHPDKGPEKVEPKGKLAPRCPLFCVLFLYNCMALHESAVSLSFLRSVMVCPMPKPFGNYTDEDKNPIPCPLGTELGNSTDDTDVCVALPREHKDWSMSPGCADQTIVVRRSQVISSGLGAIGLVGGIFGASTVGTAFIDSWGRKPMMQLSQMSTVMFTGLFAFLAWSSYLWDDVSWSIYAVCLLNAMINTFVPASGAMVTDGTEPDSIDRTNGMVGSAIVGGLAVGFAGVVAAYIVSLRLLNYTWLWAGYSFWLIFLTVLCGFVLIETKPELSEEDLAARPSICQLAISEVKSSWGIATSDRKLMWGIIISSWQGALIIVALQSVGSWGALYTRLSPAVIALVGPLGSICSLFGVASASMIARRYSAITSIYLSSVVTVVGTFFFYLGYLLPDFKLASFWIAVAIVSLGLGLMGVATPLLLSSRVAPENMGKFFSAWTALGSLVSAFVIILSTQFLITSEDTEGLIWEMARNYIIGLICQMVIIPAWYVTWGVESEKITREGSRLSFVKTSTGSRVMDEVQLGAFAKNEEGKPNVEVKDGGLHF